MTDPVDLRLLAGRRTLVRVTEDFPMLGCIAYGLIDRGWNLIQVRPTSLCPLSCIFCSTDAGPRSRRRQAEYLVVSLDALVEKFEEVVRLKGPRGIEAHIDTVGDPLTHPKIVDLVQMLRDIPGVEVISMQTHGFLLSERLIDELDSAGLSRINLSIDALDPDLARLLAGTPEYDVRRILRLAEYIVKNTRIDLLIAPVWVPGYNDSEIPKIIEFALKIGAGKRWPPLGIQKWIAHKRGRKPRGVKEMPWSEFYARLREWERKYRVKLVLTPEDFGMHRRPQVRVPFRLGETVEARVIAPGWLKGEALAVSRGWAVTIVGVPRVEELLDQRVMVKIIKIKDTIVLGRLAV